MRRASVLILGPLVLLVAACSSSSSSSKPAASVHTTSTSASSPAKLAWLEQFTTPKDLRAEDYNGTTVYVSDSERNVYAKRCADAKALTSDGGKYGAKPRNADNTGGENGYQYTCLDS